MLWDFWKVVGFDPDFIRNVVAGKGKRHRYIFKDDIIFLCFPCWKQGNHSCYFSFSSRNLLFIHHEPVSGKYCSCCSSHCQSDKLAEAKPVDIAHRFDEDEMRELFQSIVEDPPELPAEVQYEKEEREKQVNEAARTGKKG